MFDGLHPLTTRQLSEAKLIFTIPNWEIKLVGGWATPLKNMSSSIGMIIETQYEWENKIHGNQTTNQLKITLSHAMILVGWQLSRLWVTIFPKNSGRITSWDSQPGIFTGSLQPKICGNYPKCWSVEPWNLPLSHHIVICKASFTRIAVSAPNGGVPNRGYPQPSSIFIANSIINHLFLDTPMTSWKPPKKVK